MWRFHILLSYDRAVARGLSIDPRAWIYSFDYSIAISGAVWGIGGLIIGLHTDLTGHILFTLCVCGLVAGSVATFFTHLRTLFAFATPTILPFSIQLILSNTREDIVIGGCLLTFAGIVSIIAVQVHDSLDRVLPKRKDAESLGKSRQQSLEQRRVEHLYRAALLTSSGSVLTASTAIFILRNEVDFTNAALWIVAICVAVSLRVLKVVQFRRGSVGAIQSGYWLRNFNYPLILVGLVWACGAIALPAPDSLLGDMLMMVCMFGLVAGGVASFASHMSAVLSLALPSVLPFAIHLMFQGDSLRITLGIALLVFSTVIIIAGMRSGRLVRDGFAHEIENEALIAELTERNHTIEELNCELETRVRMRTEELELIVEELHEQSGELSDSRKRYYDIVEQTSSLIQSVNKSGMVVFANSAWKRTLGYDDDDLERGISIFHIIAPDSLEHCRSAFEKLLGGTDVPEIDFTVLNKDRRRVHLAGSIRSGHDSNGERVTFGIFSDATSHKESVAALQTSEARFQAIFERGSTGILIVGPDMHVVEANIRAAEIVSTELESLSDKSIVDLVKVGHRPDFEQSLQAIFNGAQRTISLEMECVTATEKVIWGRYDINVIDDADGNPRFVAVLLQDVSERKVLADALSYNAAHDHLTGLINRREFERYLNASVSAAGPECPHALVYLDLDRFKLINDTCGHTTGDLLLRALSEELACDVPDDCQLARIGGDEFALLIPNTSTGEAHVMARSLIERVVKFNFQHEGKRHSIGISAGIVIIRENESVQDIMQKADAACYAAKRAGRNRIEIYNPEKGDMRVQRDQLRAAAALADALHENQLSLYAQPISLIDAKDVNTITRYEILLRLIAKDGTISGPGELFPAAERYGYAAEVDQWVVEHTLEMLSQAASSQTNTLMLAVNISGQSLLNEQFIEFLTASLTRYPFGRNICFEITESQFISNLEQATNLMHGLRSFGCRFSLDDFGTGFSSYGYLKELDVDYLKIDGTFIRDIDSNPIDEAIVSSIVGVARAMGKQTVAEYVERPEQIDVLKRLRIDMVQGYGVGIEVPLESIIKRPSRARAQ